MIFRSRVSTYAGLAGLLAINISASAWAAEPTSPPSLGQSWPNTTDVSASPYWHVYVIDRDGIRYIQINDLNGTVRGAIATMDGQYLVLPMGTDSLRFGTPQQPLVKAMRAGTTRAPQEIFRDSNVKVFVRPLGNGAVSLDAVSTACEGNPDECGAHLTQ